MHLGTYVLHTSPRCNVDLRLSLTLEPIVIHVVAVGLKILQRWVILLFVGVCRFGTTALAAVATGQMLVVCVGSLSSRLILLVSAVVSAAASFLLPFF